MTTKTEKMVVQSIRLGMRLGLGEKGIWARASIGFNMGDVYFSPDIFGNGGVERAL